MDTNQRERSTQPRRRPASQSGSSQRRSAPASNAQRRAAAPADPGRRQSAQRPAQKRPASSSQRGSVPRRSDSLTDSRRSTTKKKTGLSAVLSRLGIGKASGRDKRDQAARAAKLKAMRQEVAAKNDPKQKRRVSRPHSPAQPIVYTQPKAFNVHRLLVQLMSILAVVMALIFGMSVFFRVEIIEVSGANVYTEWAIREASGIEEGDRLLTFSRPRATGKIYAALPYVDHVRYGIKLPNTVIIDIDEIDVVYAIASADGTWYLMSSQGKVVEQTDGSTAANYTKVLGVTLKDPTVGMQAVAYEDIVFASDVDDSESETLSETMPVVSVTNATKLATALTILQSLERNGIVGEAASVDVSDLDHIELMYGTRYEVNLGNSDRMDFKIAAMTDTINQLAEYQTGELDVSFKIWEDMVGYTPFE